MTSDSSLVAGVGPCLVDLLENIGPNRIWPVVVCPSGERDDLSIVPKVEALGITVFKRYMGSWLSFGCSGSGVRGKARFVLGLRGRIWGLANLIERHSIDLVYTNGLPVIDGAIAAKVTQRPHIWHVHEAVRGNTDFRAHLPPFLIETIVGRLSARVIVNSGFLKSEFARVARYSPLEVVHNGIEIRGADEANLQGLREAVRRDLGLSTDAMIVMSIGTICRRKAQDLLVDVAARLAPLFPKLVFLLCGAEVLEYSSEVKREIAGRKLEGRFRFLGPRKDVARLLKAADLVVHSARQEAFGRVLVEAMAGSRAIVSTRSGGPDDIVSEGETGFLVPVDDVAAMADRVRQLLQSPELRARMGVAGRERVVKAFSVKRYGAEIERIILEVFQGYKGRSPDRRPNTGGREC